MNRLSKIIMGIFAILLLLSCSIVSPIFFGYGTNTWAVLENDEQVIVVGRCGPDTWLALADTSGVGDYLNKNLPRCTSETWGYCGEGDKIILTNAEYTIALDSDGDELWSSELVGHTISTNSEGNYFITQSLKTVEINGDGETVRNYGFGGGRGSGFVKVLNKFVGLLSNKVEIRNSAGAFENSITFSPDSTSQFEGQRIDYDSFGSIYISGSVYNDTTTYGLFIKKYDPLLNEKWTIVISNDTQIELTSFKVDNQGNSYIGAIYPGWLPAYDGTVMKYDSSGAYVWTGSFTGSHDENIARSVLPLNDGSIFVGAETYYNSPGHGSGSEGLLAYIDPNGVEVWTHEFGGSDYGNSLLKK